MTHPVTDRTPGAPAHYKLRYPGSWWYLDLDPSTRDASIRRRIEHQARGVPQLSRERLDGLIRTTRHTAREAHARGALQAAGMVAFPGGDSMLSATSVVVRMPVPDDQSADLAEVLFGAGMQADGPQSSGYPPREVELLELPEVGPVGRIASIEDIDYKGTPVRTALLHTLFPIPGRREYLVVSSSTPNVELKDQFFEVFDAIAGTLRFVQVKSKDTAGPAAQGPQGMDENGK
ncbi:hypothetical protein ACFXPZ_07970 [Streptomyces sp. NPDC059101]|uniref:hypothetical protein n=1 Tax=Streptomyces sp. NPDC059101 TaxID=3346728 RepID=UPI0036BE3D1D